MASTGASLPVPMPVATNGTLQPTWRGYIGNTQDAMILLEACFEGELSHLARRPHDKERVDLIKSGNVFIHEANSSGVKRWTDGITWSPSRMVGNFLVYRELNKPFAPGEKKRAMAKDKRQGIQKKRGDGANSTRVYSGVQGAILGKELERSLVGSLVDSYDFKEQDVCLIKKTITIKVKELTHHIVSYYTIDDVVSGKLQTPRSDPRFQHLKPRRDIISSKSYKHPPDDLNVLSEDDDVRGNHSVFQDNPGRGDYNFPNRNAPRLPAPSLNTGMAYPPNNIFANSHYPMSTSYNPTPYNGSLPAVSSGAGSYNPNIPGEIPNTVSPYNGGLSATSSNGGSSYAQYGQVPGMYDTQKPDPYGYLRLFPTSQRSNTIPNMNTTPIAHRTSSYGQQSLGSGVSEISSGMPGMLQGQMGSRNPHDTGMLQGQMGSRNPHDTGVSGMPAMLQGPMGSRNLGETAYGPTNLFQSRDTPNTPDYPHPQRNLPASNQLYNSQTSNQYTHQMEAPPGNSSAGPQTANQYTHQMEAPPGNASAGHAHYMMNPQGTWPSPN